MSGIPSVQYVIATHEARVEPFSTQCEAKAWAWANGVKVEQVEEVMTPFCYWGNSLAGDKQEHRLMKPP